ncbi:MAG: response regulator [Flavobacterium sp.]|nr:response regulator [Flavobacterium sp.]
MESPFAFSVMKGKDMVITLANDLIKEFWGKGNQVEGKALMQVLPEIKDQPFPAMIDSVYTTGIPVYANEILARLQHNDKMKERYFNVVFQPDYNADRTISGVVTIAYEVTEMVLSRKKIEGSERNLRRVLDTMPQKITNADTEGNVIYFNQKWLDDTVLKFEKLKGWGWEKVIHPDDVELTKINWTNSLKSGDVFDMECRILNKEGDYRWHLSRALPIKDKKGRIKMWVGTNTEIHEQKEAKNKAEIASQIAESAVKAKQQFLSNMSHEIRTPMNAIIGFTNVMLKTALSEKQKEYINAIKVSGDALIVLINDILDIAKVDAGKMTFEQTPFALSDSISTTLHLFEPKIQEKNIELIKHFDAAIPKILLGDSLRLRQIILNLLSNAVKFTDEGKITLSVQKLKEEANDVTIEFSVSDTGIGIPENKLDFIFGDFQQATDETSKLYAGTGLGLSIVKQFVELQGGTIFVNSKPRKGSTFGFILNFKKVIAETTEILKTTEPENRVELVERIENIRILVVEDMPLNQLLIKIILLDFGFDVDIADNGKIAIEKLQENKYDIILMDLQMPELNGFEATEHIRRKMNSQIPIIALTADVTTVDVNKCKAVGMNDYISKPVDENVLYRKIIKYIKKTK